MTEKTPTESIMIDQENAKLTAKLFDPIAIKDLLQKFASIPGFKLHSDDGDISVIGIPATGEISHHKKAHSDNEEGQQVAHSVIKFRKNGEIILIESTTNLRTKFIANSNDFVRYNHKDLRVPYQPLPRHAKNNFLKLVIEAQDQIKDLLERLEVSTSV